MVEEHAPLQVAAIDLELTCRRPLAAASGVDRWVARAITGAGRGDPGPSTADPVSEELVGRIEVLSVDLARCRDPWAELDASNDAVAHIGETVFDQNTGQLAQGFDSRLRGSGDRVLVVDYVELEPAWQRQNLAGLLVAVTLDQLRAGCRVFVCLPGPLERRSLDDHEHERAVHRMQVVWGQIGFTPYEGGVWYLDPQTGALHDGLVDLRRRHGLPEHV